jgi:acetoin utilization protein AcuC
MYDLRLKSDKVENILIYSDKLASFEYSDNHPFKPGRAKQMMDLLNRYSLIFEENQDIIEPEPIDEELLCLFHDKEYIDLLRKCEKGEFDLEMYGAGLGTADNPVIQGMYEFSKLAAGATHMGAIMLLDNRARMVFNPVGGFHHAGHSHAEGFCYVNDLAIAIADLVKRGQRVAYIDIDVHYGNGVRDAFASTDKVLTISTHESGMTLYPWSGFEDDFGIRNGKGHTVNIPLLKGSDDEVFLYCFESIVPPLIEAFKPDIVVAEIGGDMHRDDPLGHLNVTSNGFVAAVNKINEFSPKVLVTGGGGYNVFKTAALWTLAWAVLCDIEPEDYYAGIVGGMMYGPETDSGTLHDKPFVLEGDLKDLCVENARDIVDYLKKNLFPMHGIKA